MPIGRWMDKEVVVQIKMTEFEWILVRWMNPEPAIESDVSHKDKYHILAQIYMEFRKLLLMNLFGGQQQRCRHRQQTCGRSRERRGWGELRECHWNTRITTCKHRWPVGICCRTQGPWSSALWQPREEDGMWGRKDVGRMFMRERTYVYPWGTHVDAWQKPAQHCKAIILQVIIKIKKKKKCVFRPSAH